MSAPVTLEELEHEIQLIVYTRAHLGLPLVLDLLQVGLGDAELGSSQQGSLVPSIAVVEGCQAVCYLLLFWHLCKLTPMSA